MERILLVVIFMTSVVTFTLAQTCTEVNHCSSCHNPDVECLECNVGKIDSVTEEGCDDCENNCAVCERAEDEGGQKYLKCTECLPRHEMTDSGKCLSCGSWCTSCGLDLTQTGTDCNTCEAGYYLNGNKDCSSCPEGCAECSFVEEEVVCDKCHENHGLFLAQGECDVCRSNCEVCASAADCELCDDGYRLENSGGCKACEDDCRQCTLNSETNSDDCDDCDTGFTMTGDTDTCDECDDSHCIKCDDSRTGCELCDDLYTVDVQDETCTVCLRYCTDCTWSESKGRTTCLQDSCEEGYVRDEEELTCEPCPAKCTSAGCGWSDGKAICTDCLVEAEELKSWGKVTDQTECRACPSRCEACSHNATTDTMECDTCFGRHVMEDVPNDVCMECPEHCTDCEYGIAEEKTICLDCDEGYYLNNDDGTCDVCTVDFCSECNATVCNTCMTGYPPSPDGDKCHKCQNECDLCELNPSEDGTACVSESNCDAYFGLDSTNGECVSCRSNCQRCDVSGTDRPCQLNKCDPAYIRNDDRDCIECPSNCAECTFDADNGAICTECNNRYSLNQGTGQCLACTDNCKDCTHTDDETVIDENRVKCDTDKCVKGYGLTSEGRCEDCPGECDECDFGDDGVTCSTCADRHRMNTMQCSVCPRHCEKCSHEEGEITCDECDHGYTLDRQSGICQQCPVHCKECNYNGESDKTECKEHKCYHGYGRDNNKECTACSVMFAKCGRCSDSSGGNSDPDEVDCMRCEEGSVLSDDKTKCIDDPTVNCDHVEDRPYICNEGKCDSMHTWLDGVCGAVCYVCGDTKNETLKTTCGYAIDNDNATHPSVNCKEQCWATRKKQGEQVTFARGCGVPDNKNITCDGHQDETCFDRTQADGTVIQECWRCTDQNRRNGWKINGAPKLMSHPGFLLLLLMMVVALIIV